MAPSVQVLLLAILSVSSVQNVLASGAPKDAEDTIPLHLTLGVDAGVLDGHIAQLIQQHLPNIPAFQSALNRISVLEAQNAQLQSILTNGTATLIENLCSQQSLLIQSLLPICQQNDDGVTRTTRTRPSTTRRPTTVRRTTEKDRRTTEYQWTNEYN